MGGKDLEFRSGDDGDNDVRAVVKAPKAMEVSKAL